MCGHDHRSGRECYTSVPASERQVPRKFMEPITEQYTVEEDVTKYREEMRDTTEVERVPYTATRPVQKTRRVPVQRVRRVQYTDYEQRTTQIPCSWSGANGYTTYQTTTVPVSRWRDESYTEYIDEPYTDIEPYTTYHEHSRPVRKMVRVPYTAREKVTKTRTIGEREVTRMVSEKVTKNCGCTYVFKDRCECRRYPFEALLCPWLYCRKNRHITCDDLCAGYCDCCFEYA